MNLQSHVDRLAKSVALLDETDASCLEELRLHLLEFLMLAAEDELGDLHDACERGIEAVGALMAGDADPAEGLAVLHELASFAQSVVDGGPAPAGADPCPTEGDPELLAMFVSSTTDNVAEVEESLMGLEGEVSDAQRAELLGQLKRALHTIKGECGVIPLVEAQQVVHHAEDRLERTEGEGRPVPAELLFAVVDWLKTYVEQLAAGGGAAPPEHAELLTRLRAEEAPGAEPAPDPAPTSDAAAPATEDSLDLDERITFPAKILEDEVLPDFVAEAREHLDASEASLLDLEATPDDIELINAIFRAFHTIKGVAGYLNLAPMVELAHTAETLMDLLRKGETTCEKLHLDLIFDSCDLMNAMVGALEGGEGPLLTELSRLVARLEAAIDGREYQDEEGELLPILGVSKEEALATSGQQPKRVTRLLGAILIEQGVITEGVADVMAQRQKDFPNKPFGQLLVDSGLVTQADIEAALLVQAKERAEGPGAPATPSPEPAAPASSEPLAAPVAEEPAAPRPEPEPAPEPEAVVAPQPPAQPAKQPAPKNAAKEAAPIRRPRPVASTIKVNTGRLDSLVDLVGELVIAQQMIYQDPDLEDLASERLTRNLAQVAKITRDMHEAAMSLRMVTLKPTFQKMARLVRDVSAKAGKEVQLVLSGEDTELDRNVVEEISDPMVHLIRNAIDHGLETPEERRAVGKSSAGCLQLRAFHQGGSIVIEIVDDGRGLNRERILAKAAEKGLLPKDVDPEEIPDGQVWDMIFQAGFSTAAVVSDISGRGVGMDVVRRNIEKMRGKVEIVSTPGEGSVFSLRLPLTLAIIDGMIVRVGDQRYVLPTLSIEQSFRPGSDQLHEVMNEGQLVKVRDMLLPIHRLRDLFDQEDGAVDPDDGILIVLEDNGQRCCLMVDEILGQQQVVIKSLGEAGALLRGISGGAILGDGRIALIVDVDGIVTRTPQTAA